MRAVESFVAGKAGDPQLCEDAVIVTEGHAAIVDGATDITGQGYGVPAVTGGRWAMAACVSAITALPEDADVESATVRLTSTLAERIDPELPPHLRPSASVTIYSRQRRQVWQLGDVGFSYAGMPAAVGQPRKPLDRIAAEFRAAVIAAEIAGVGTGALDLTVTDPGRLAARALISRQGALRNTTGPYGFAAIDGRPVPPSLIVVHDVPRHVEELVLASDGYPVILPTLAETEARLAELLAEDPHCIGPLCGTKGVMAGQTSFDDRSYLRLRLS
ncbi:hypothetical protein ACWEOZ_30175 [Actinoplanes sp. NPDC004185]